MVLRNRAIYQDQPARIIIVARRKTLHLEAGYIYADCPSSLLPCSTAADHTLSTVKPLQQRGLQPGFGGIKGQRHQQSVAEVLFRCNLRPEIRRVRGFLSLKEVCNKQYATRLASGYPESVWQSALGKQKVPTLRNVALRPSKDFVKAYSHNGYFKSLHEIVHFYNTRDVAGAGWPAPEVAVNINTTEVGNLGLNYGEELAIVSFLETLSDGYTPKK